MLFNGAGLCFTFKCTKDSRGVPYSLKKVSILSHGNVSSPLAVSFTGMIFMDPISNGWSLGWFCKLALPNWALRKNARLDWHFLRVYGENMRIFAGLETRNLAHHQRNHARSWEAMSQRASKKEVLGDHFGYPVMRLLQGSMAVFGKSGRWKLVRFSCFHCLSHSSCRCQRCESEDQWKLESEIKQALNMNCYSCCYLLNLLLHVMIAPGLSPSHRSCDSRGKVRHSFALTRGKSEALGVSTTHSRCVAVPISFLRNVHRTYFLLCVRISCVLSKSSEQNHQTQQDDSTFASQFCLNVISCSCIYWT